MIGPLSIHPLTVDSLMTSPSWTAEGDQASANFGRDARGSALPAGVYFVRLSFDGRVETQKLVVAW
jgi:hypothetical protein